MRIGSLSFSKKILLFITIITGFSIIGIAHGEQAGAWPLPAGTAWNSSSTPPREGRRLGLSECADGAGLHTGNTHDYAGAIVELKFNGQPAKGNIQAVVRNYNGQSGSGGNIFNPNTGARYMSGAFNLQNNVCGRDSAAVLGYNKSSQRNGAAGPWTLDCDESIHGAGNGQDFEITGQGVPNGARSGGDWTKKYIRSDNGFTLIVQVAYNEPPAPTKWNLEVKSQVQNSNGKWTQKDIYRKRGQTVKFSYLITNTGDAPSPSFERWRNTDYNGAHTNGSHVNQSGLGVNDSIRKPDPIEQKTIPNNAPFGAKYCFRGYANRTNSDNPNQQNPGNNVCVIVSPSSCIPGTGDPNCPDDPDDPTWSLSLSSSVSAPYVEQGGAVNFAHSITNTGNQWGTKTASGFTRCAVYNYNPDNSNEGASGDRCGRNIPAVIPPGTFLVTDNDYPTLYTSNYTPRGAIFCQRYSVGWQAEFNHVAADSANACTVVVGGTSSVRTNSTKPYIEPTETGTLTSTVNTQNFVGGGGWPGYTVNCSYNITANGSPIESGSCGTAVGGDGDTQTVNWQRVAQPGDVGTQYCLNVFSAGTTNPYFFTGQPTSQSCFRVIARPYFKVYGGDVMAGCSVTNASIIAWNKNGEGGSFNGAGASLAVFAQNVIKGFASGQTVPNSPGFATGPTNLSFANSNDSDGVATSVGDGVDAGGNFGGNVKAGNCMSDYFGGMPSGDELDTGGWPGVNEANLRTVQNFVINGNLNDMTSITGETPTVAQGSRIRLYVKGDVYISKNIIPSTAPNNTIENIPSITVVARNIYIGPGVTQLYGTYVAQSIDGAGGNLYTCASGLGAPLSVTATGSNYNACRSQLVFTGSVVAKKIHLLRSWGSLYQDSGGFAPSNSAAAGGAGYSGAGEVFRFNPLVWQRESTGGPGDPPVTLYDFITTLPSDL